MISNTGTEDLIISSLFITGIDASEFVIQNDNCSGQTVVPLETCTVEVVFVPTSIGIKGVKLSIPTNDPDTTKLDVELSGTATTEVCPSKNIYGEYSEKTELLRYFRDNVLSTTPEGQEIIKLYYEWSPVIVKMMEEDEEFKEDVREMIDGILPLIRANID